MKHLIRAAVAAAFAAYHFHERHLIARGKAGADLDAHFESTPREMPQTDLAAYLAESKRIVADLAGMGPVQAADFDLWEREYAYWLHPSNGGEVA